MKTLALASGLILLIMSARVQGQFTYTTNDGTITITKYTGRGGKVDIPRKIKGLPVTRIGFRAFTGSTNLTRITIPDGVTDIGELGFYFCNNLISVTLPGSVTSIGEFGFGHCASLPSISIPDSVTNIGGSAFSFCKGLTSVTMGKGVTSVKESTFFSCFNLTSVTLPDSLTRIGTNSFANCWNLTNLALPNSLTNIEERAFANCASLESVTIPASAANLGDQAFVSCNSLTAISVDPLNPFYKSSDGVLFNKSQTLLIQYPGGKMGSYEIPDGVTSIGSWAFAGCSSLASITLPNSVTSLGGWAFETCTSLTGVYFKGNAPSVHPNLAVKDDEATIFAGDNQATIYYLAGTTGWEPSFCGRPTKLWKLPLQNNITQRDLRTNPFGFTILGTNGLTIVIEVSTNLMNPVWIPLQTNVFSSDSFFFSDPQWMNYPSRFYRIRLSSPSVAP